MVIKEECFIKALQEKRIDAIMHQSNCFQKMGSGVAKDIAKAFPVAYFADQQSHCGALEKLGTFTKAVTENGGIVYNLYGQYMYGRTVKQTDYSYLLGAFRKAVRDALENGCKTIGIPFKMGCNNAGGDWEIVKQFVIGTVEKEFESFGIQIIVFNKYSTN